MSGWFSYMAMNRHMIVWAAWLHLQVTWQGAPALIFRYTIYRPIDLQSAPPPRWSVCSRSVIIPTPRMCSIFDRPLTSLYHVVMGNWLKYFCQTKVFSNWKTVKLLVPNQRVKKLNWKNISLKTFPANMQLFVLVVVLVISNDRLRSIMLMWAQLPQTGVADVTPTSVNSSGIAPKRSEGDAS